MKVFYGYRRARKDVPEGMDNVYLDDERTGRQERADMMDHGLRGDEGDTLYLLSLTDLGRGAEAKVIEENIRASGAGIVVIKPEKPVETRGRPAVFKPSPEQDQQCKTLYHSYLQMSHVLNRVEQIMGQRFKAHHLKARYGRRWPDTDKEQR